MKSGQFLHYVAQTAGASAITTLTAVVIASVTAKTLGPEGRGALSLLVLIPIMVMTFGRLGVGHAINYYASRWPREQLVASGLAVAIIAGVGLTILTVPAVILLRDVFFRGTTTGLIVLACSLIPFSFLQEYVTCLFQGYYDMRERNLLVMAGPLLNLVLLLALVVVLKWDLFGATLAYVAANIAVALWSVMRALAPLGGMPLRPQWRQMRALVTYGFQSHVGLVFKELNYRGNAFLVSFFLGPAGVGLYAAAVNVAEMLWKLPEAAGTVLLPKVAHMEPGEAAVFAGRVLRALFLPMFAATIGILVLGRHIVLLMFGPEFAGSVAVLWWLLPGMFAMAFWKILANTLVGLGHAMKYSVTSGVGLVIMLGLDLVLIPRFGLSGAAAASSVSYVSATLFISYLFCAHTGMSIAELWRPRRGDLSVYHRLFAALGRRAA